MSLLHWLLFILLTLPVWYIFSSIFSFKTLVISYLVLFILANIFAYYRYIKKIKDSSSKD